MRASLITRTRSSLPIRANGVRSASPGITDVTTIPEMAVAATTVTMRAKAGHVGPAVNGAAQVILRYNKIRLYELLDALGAPRFELP